MGATVSSMFSHAPQHAVTTAPSAGTTLAAVALLALAALLALVLRRRGGGATAGTPAGRGRTRRATGRGLTAALGAFRAPGPAAGPPLRVLSRLALGPGRYLCMVEAGSRVLLVAVGGEVRLLGDVEATLPRNRRRRQAVANQLLVEQVAGLERGDGPAPATVVDLGARRTRAVGAEEWSPSAPGEGESADERAAEAPAVEPGGRMAALLERYLAVASPVDRAGAGGGDDDEAGDAAYFSRLLEASIARMEAAEDRLFGGGGRDGGAAAGLGEGGLEA